MQRPIRKGERILALDLSGKIWEIDCANDLCGYHPQALRLPDAFQKQECKGCVHDNCQCQCECHGEQNPKPAPSPEKLDKCPWCGGFNFHNEFCNRPGKPKDAVECGHDPKRNHNCWKPKNKLEETIKRLVWIQEDRDKEFIEKELRDLVRLARETK